MRWKLPGPCSARAIARICLLSALVIPYVFGCAGFQGLSMSFPSPPDVTITAPAPDLVPELAAFSGRWEGFWGGVLPSRLIVERIDAGIAHVVYFWGAHPNGHFQAGYSRHVATVRPGGKIEFGGSDRPHFVFTMSKDRSSIAGTRESQGHTDTVLMWRVSGR